ncbi:hypothetical protein G6F22_012915 [Rhizopus arrhizus]|nr:hypothetical protein G6F22_012915 [Rhizopus arrhizus]
MGNAYPHAACEAVLHPADVIATTVQIPAVARPRFAAAVHSALEPLVLSDLDALAIGYGARGADGKVPLAWAPREPVRRAPWRPNPMPRCATRRIRAGARPRRPGRWPCRN